MKRSSLLLTLIGLLCLTLMPTIAQGDLTAELQTIVADLAAPDGPAVVLRVATPDGVWTVASGMADIAGGIPATVTDRFRIGSMTKTFVAVVTLQLVEAGDLSLDDRAADYLPGEVSRRIANAERATIHQLLNHSSGIYDYLESDDFWHEVYYTPTHRWTPDEVLTYAYDEDAYFTPGTDWEYSNTNYILLQLVLEAVTGEPLHVLIREGILDPLGLADTYMEHQETLPGGLVHGYEDIDEDGDPDDTLTYNDGTGMGDGGLIATAADLSAFYAGLVNGELLSASSLDMMLTGINVGYGEVYGLGISIYDDPDWGRIIGHEGATAGFAGAAYALPDCAATVVWLTASERIDWPDFEDLYALLPCAD